MPAPINIAQTPQLLADNLLVEYVNFVTRVVHAPVKHPANPIVRADKPWEITSYFRTNTWNVHWDERESLFKLWYEDMAWDYDEYLRLERAGAGRRTEEVAAVASYEKTIDNRLLYAESANGIEWTKPQLDYRDVDGHKTNICLGGPEDGRVNAACGDRGFLDVELADADDDVVSGYDRASCDTFRGDAIDHIVAWNGQTELPAETLKRGPNCVSSVATATFTRCA